MTELSQNPNAVRKRNSRIVQREKRRRSFFIHDYIRTKYPTIFNEANGMYQQLVEKYPAKPDFTKTYYFKKWQKEADKNRSSSLMIPHLPVLTSLRNLHQYAEISHQQADHEPNEPDEPNEPNEQLHEEAIQNSTQEPTYQFEEMSLDEIDQAVEKIVSALQEDQELMDMIPEFDLPADVWEKELAIPDHLLENELQW